MFFFVFGLKKPPLNNIITFIILTFLQLFIISCQRWRVLSFRPLKTIKLNNLKK